ncbi:uncharacterized protein RJT21DRAFT_118898 [Scheffersomyces amazonensis]|uniref:uncharacterized protein n=1 Tax=Scheffersomyces amazonensis TaxID=1078765 RepID=UPI00315D1F9A
MLSRISFGRISRRTYSGFQSPLSFIPNEDKHIFESEKLTPEQNESAIPDKPILENVTKYSHEIVNPEDIADVLTRPDENDFVVTLLSKDGIFLGNPNHKLINKDSSKDSHAPEFHFSNIASSWIEVFNKSIIPLNEVTDSSSILKGHINKDSFKQISKRKHEFCKTNPNFYNATTLKAFFSSIRAFENSERNLSGLVSPTELQKTVTFENTIFYLLNEDEVLNDDKNFAAVLEFLMTYNEFSSVAKLTLFLDHLINYLSKSASIDKIKSFRNFFNATFPNLNLIEDLDAKSVDKLAMLLSKSGEIKLAQKLLILLVENKRVNPSQETLDSYLLAYEQFGEQSKEEFLRNFSSLKPIFFNQKLSSISFQILLNRAIYDIEDFHHFINLVSNADNSESLFTNFQNDIFQKLRIIHNENDYSKSIKALNYIQLIKRLQTKESLKFNVPTKELLSQIFKELELNSEQILENL